MAATLPGLTAVFVAGLLTVLTPCCIPMIPPLLSGSVGHRLRPVSIVSGSVITFTALGVASGTLGSLSPESLRLPSMVLIIGFGAVMADDDFYAVYSKYSSRVSSSASRAVDSFDSDEHPLASAFFLGLLLGAIWLPCVGPVLGAVLAYVGTTGDVVTSGSLLFVYGVGFSVPLLGIAYGGKTGGKALMEKLSLERTEKIRQAAGYLLIATGVGILFEVDRLLMSVM